MAVTDETVQSAIEDGATSVGEVTTACRAGGDCGSCHDMIEDMIESHCEAQKKRLRVIAA